MRIPAAPTQGHESGACLHNTAGGAEALHVAIPGGHLIFGQPPRVFLLEIQGIEQAVAGDDAESLFVKFIEADHLLAIIDVAPELIEAVEQLTAIAQSVGGHAVEGKVLLTLAARRKGLVRRAEKAWSRVALAQGNVGRRAVEAFAFHLGHHRTNAWPAAAWLWTAALVASHAMKRVVIVDLPDGRSDGRTFVPHLRQLWKIFTDTHPGNTGGNGVKLAAIFQRRFLLNIPHVHMTRTAGQEDHDHALLALGGHAGFGLGL